MAAAVEARCWERLVWSAGRPATGSAPTPRTCAPSTPWRLVDDAPTRARVMASHAAALVIFGSLNEAGVRAQEALAVATAAGYDTARASALDTWGVVAALRGDPDEGPRALREARGVALACGSDDELWRAVPNGLRAAERRAGGGVGPGGDRAVVGLGDGPHPPAAVPRWATP